MDSKYDNSDRFDAVTEQEWREALDELTAYLSWRLMGKTTKGAHSESELGMPALDYYQEEAVVKLIEGVWKWQERYTLGKQLVQIATNLITKQVERYKRSHPSEKDLALVEIRDPERLPDTIDDDGQAELDETYDQVFALVADDEELTLYVEAIVHCNKFKELPAYLGIPIKRVYRLQEKLMRRIRRWQAKYGQL